MMRLLEAKRAIHLTSSDFYHRLRELRERVSGKRTVMRSNANMYESRDQVESMLDMTELRLSLPFDRGFKDSFGSPFLYLRQGCTVTSFSVRWLWVAEFGQKQSLNSS
ncbi:hypothetical protein [Comamonas testosteroni]|uniref:hypothetical protein n=1 Tax=Comamonas testosteroni TaxID=285 RepID=UPI00391C01DA